MESKTTDLNAIAKVQGRAIQIEDTPELSVSDGLQAGHKQTPLKATLIRVITVTIGGGLIGHFLFAVPYGPTLIVGNILGALVVEAFAWGIGKLRRATAING